MAQGTAALPHQPATTTFIMDDTVAAFPQPERLPAVTGSGNRGAIGTGMEPCRLPQGDIQHRGGKDNDRCMLARRCGGQCAGKQKRGMGGEDSGLALQPVFRLTGKG